MKQLDRLVPGGDSRGFLHVLIPWGVETLSRYNLNPIFGEAVVWSRSQSQSLSPAKQLAPTWNRILFLFTGYHVSTEVFHFMLEPPNHITVKIERIEEVCLSPHLVEADRQLVSYT